MSTSDPVLVAHLHRLLVSRPYPKTICPSEAPRAMSGADLRASGAREWRELMPPAREVLFEMRERGEVDIMQGGEVIADDVAASDIKGPIRARLDDTGDASQHKRTGITS
eukprot:TRINITY_DN19889_c0_g1_i1.p2 TRINITY_DN19889_c0_g1~~TRINITY_DN19889_c0_g1_i1.p2  ORF type:complete len:110 (-),score=7.09 TRINITY_DN19889_c0_g1_i1:1-330(-)